MESKKRLGWIDMCRGIVMILVVLGHTLTYNSNLRFIIFTFHMPVLFIISGFVFKPRVLCISAPKYAKRLLMPMYVAGIALLIYRIMSMIIEQQKLADICYWIKRTIVAVLFASGVDTPKGFPWVHTFGMLWFLAAMFWAMILLTVIFNNTEKNIIRIILCLSGTVVGMVISRYVWLPMNFDIALIVLTYLCVGYYLKINSMDNMKLMIPIIVFCGIIWGVNYMLGGKIELAQRRFDIPVLSFAASVAGSILVMYICKITYRKNKLTDALQFVGKNSMTVLVIHFIDSNMIPWNLILQGNPAGKRYIITWFILRMAFIMCILAVWVWIKGKINSGKKDKLSV